MASYIDPAFRESLLKKSQDRTAQVILKLFLIIFITVLPTFITILVPY